MPLLFQARKNRATKLTKSSDKLAIENTLLPPSSATVFPRTEKPVKESPETANIETTVIAAIAINEI